MYDFFFLIYAFVYDFLDTFLYSGVVDGNVSFGIEGFIVYHMNDYVMKTPVSYIFALIITFIIFISLVIFITLFFYRLLMFIIRSFKA